MKRNYIYLYFILLFSSAPLFSQQGSSYSMFGLGDFSISVSSGYEAMGGTSIAMPDNNAINFLNPAIWTQVNTTRLQAGYRFNQHFVSDAKNKQLQNNGTINSMSTIFMIDTNRRIAASFGIYPSTRINYSVKSIFTIVDGSEVSQGQCEYQGQGGLSSLYLGLASRIWGPIFAGATIFGNFGSAYYTNKVEYFDVYNYNTYYQKKDNFSGFGYKFGLYSQIPLGFSIGAYFENNNTIDIERQQSYGSDLVTDTSIYSNASINAPKKFGIGVGFKTGKFQFGGDFNYLIISDLNYNSTENIKFQNSYSISFGGERLGNLSKMADYLDRITYRAGFGYSNLYYQVMGKDINEYKFSIGGSFPVSNSGMIDGTLVFGLRGTNSNGLVQDKYIRLIIDISIGEVWFNPFKREY
ncbi:MAG TPA: hypothetical protein PKV40_07435 [Candidatus Kapabacteria bacterium]|nr:hypothetical protein [Candidatus Kapabacteria bacterium]